MVKLTRINEDNSDEPKIHLGNEDGIIISNNVRWVYHQCCNCGKKHKWFIKAKKNKSIIIKFYPIED